MSTNQRVETSTLTWENTAPSTREAQSDDGAIWSYSTASGNTTEVTDLHEPGDDAHLDAHASATEAMYALGWEC